ncbi:MAG: hypothetical protein BWX88_02587 [Planctomycetes bacterium ADurb.Bin126]|nr:MAG: hypothetical protein BWX88_02587 [Planctomycetes bacterium ADurb.Bin126]HOD80101.1 DUF4160 domain-containing protein [Phycisphaerae bacterium]HQL76444.1 DUF4160 domain-containing protein [Phycisphaerae bacterium]
MPTISRFFGITIRMFHREHAPPHFHAHYGSDDVTIVIDSLRVLAGRLPRRAMALVLEWAAEHRDELQRNWFLANGHHPLEPIAPLE